MGTFRTMTDHNDEQDYDHNQPSQPQPGTDHARSAHLEQWLRDIVWNSYDPSVFASVPKPDLGFDAKSILPDMDPTINASILASIPGSPSLAETVNSKLAATMRSVAEKVEATLDLGDVFDAATSSAESYIRKAFELGDPLPFLERFHNDFLVAYGSFLLASGRVENLLADLCDVEFSKDEHFGATIEAQQKVSTMREAIAKRSECETCRETARGLEEALKIRNMLVHGDWTIGKDIASEKEAARYSMLRFMLPHSLVIKRKPMRDNDFEKKVAKWKKRGDLDQADILSAQSVSFGLVESFTEKFVGAGDVLEAELQKHRRERSKATL